MTRAWQLLVGFGRFWYGFVVGDDWVAAAGVVVLVVGTAVLVAAGVPSLWFGPLTVVTAVTITVRRGRLDQSRPG